MISLFPFIYHSNFLVSLKQNFLKQLSGLGISSSPSPILPKSTTPNRVIPLLLHYKKKKKKTLVTDASGLHIARLSGQFSLLNLFELPKLINIADHFPFIKTLHGVQDITRSLFSFYSINSHSQPPVLFPSHLLKYLTAEHSEEFLYIS